MSNHVHLAIQAANTPLSKIAQNLAFRYTRLIERREKRTGHLFQRRFLVRYIHLNPVRAQLAERPADCAWSGHLAYLERAGIG